MDVDDSLKCSFVHLFIHSSFILANDGGGGGGGGGWMEARCAVLYTHVLLAIPYSGTPPVVLLA